MFPCGIWMIQIVRFCNLLPIARANMAVAVEQFMFSVSSILWVHWDTVYSQLTLHSGSWLAQNTNTPHCAQIELFIGITVLVVDVLMMVYDNDKSCNFTLWYLVQNCRVQSNFLWLFLNKDDRLT